MTHKYNRRTCNVIIQSLIYPIKRYKLATRLQKLETTPSININSSSSVTDATHLVATDNCVSPSDCMLSFVTHQHKPVVSRKIKFQDIEQKLD